MSIMKIAKIKDSGPWIVFFEIFVIATPKNTANWSAASILNLKICIKQWTFTRLPKAFPISGRLTNASKKPSTGNCAAVNGENA